MGMGNCILLLLLITWQHCAVPGSCLQQPSIQCSYTPEPSTIQLDCSTIPGSQKAKPWTLAEAAKHAVRHAPIIHMHPAEDYKLTDPRDYWKAATVYGEDYLQLNKGQVQQLMAIPGANTSVSDTAALVRSFLTVLPSNLQQAVAAPSRGSYLDILAGSPVDGQGRSTARVFYQLLQPLPGGAWVYTYNLYYAWNGCGNMAFTTTVGSDAEHTLEYISCPDSVHESDWERISVVVCPSSQDSAGTVVATLLSQHNHNELLDCSVAAGQSAANTPQATGQQTFAGQCTMERADDGQLHLAVYSALHSHANYKAPSNASVFGEVANSEGDGVFILDRTADGGPVFMPTPANIMPMPGLLPDQAAGSIAAEDWAWSQYPGWWGAAEWRLPGPSITCLSANRTALAACPDNPAWRLLASILGIPHTHRQPSPADSLPLRPYLSLPTKHGTLMPYNYHAHGGAKQCPRYRPWATRWDGAKRPPMFELPANNTLFRLFLNNGKHTPHYRCFEPMLQASIGESVIQSYRAAIRRLGVLAMTPRHPLMLLLAVPLTLSTAWVLLHVPRLAARTRSTAARTAALLGPSGGVEQGQGPNAGWLLTYQQAVASWFRRNASTGGGPAYQPALGNAPELELGSTMPHHSRGDSISSPLNSGSHHRSINGSAARNSRGPTQPLFNSGGSGNMQAGRAAGRFWGAVRQKLASLCYGGVYVQGVALAVSGAAAGMYSVGLRHAIDVLNGTLGLAAPGFNTLYWFLVTVVFLLVVIHTVLLCAHCFIQRSMMPPSALLHATAGAPQHDVNGRELDALEGGSEDDDWDSETVHVMGQGAAAQGRAAVAVGALDAWLDRYHMGPSSSCHCGVTLLTSVAGVLSVTTMAAAFVLVMMQAGVQMLCQQMMMGGPLSKALLPASFSGIATTPAAPGDINAALEAAAQRMSHDMLAAVLAPIGFVQPTSGAGRLYATALCIHWRDGFGGWQLITGAVLWCALQMWLRVQQPH